MTHGSRGLRLGPPVLLSSGRVLWVVDRIRLTVLGEGAWRGVVAQREPHALLLRGAEGSVTVLAAGPEAVTMAELREALPSLEPLLGRLAAAAPTPPSACRFDETTQPIRG